MELQPFTFDFKFEENPTDNFSVQVQPLVEGKTTLTEEEQTYIAERVLDSDDITEGNLENCDGEFPELDDDTNLGTWILL